MPHVQLFYATLHYKLYKIDLQISLEYERKIFQEMNMYFFYNLEIYSLYLSIY